MSITATVKIKGYVQRYGAGRMDIDTTPLTSIVSVPSVLEIILANGNNTITYPTGATGVIITFDGASARTKILKGVAGDTGIQVYTTGLGGSMMLPLKSGNTSFVINASGLDTVITRFQFF